MLLKNHKMVSIFIFILLTLLTLVFLEFNANGQWLFLDYFNDEAILENVVNFLLPTKSNV